ncbi:MAG TPA: PQQ-dependent sugar dehydrogenase [Pyrinomonadaceae bacterium]|nr:PQQ-dependent sugar dehydrogenase [Pyrinomonadaceae bacterium]
MLILILLFLINFTSHSTTPIHGQAGSAASRKLTPNRIKLTKGRSAGSFALNLPKEFAISVAAEGLKRVRFMAKSPDGRVFVTDMFNLSDNKQGVVYILDEFDRSTRSFKKVTTYLKNLRNPNSIAFYTDPRGVNWLYLALTDRLVRYRFTKGETLPTSAPEVLATFPDYGLSYKYGGWHLTRTIAVGGNGKIYIAVGSSCNACEEKEEVRASVIEMDPDGKNQKHFARGLRNAVGLRWIDGQLFATNMGSDHLGDHKPADTMYALKDGTNYGWPYCYQSGPGRFPDPKFNARSSKLNCRNVPAAYAAFDAHSSPLGLEYFDANSTPELRDSFLVGLHGSTKENLNRGYRVVRLRGRDARTATPENFIDGFLEGKKIHGRPCDILSLGNDSFLLTDDYAGVVYYVYKK